MKVFLDENFPLALVTALEQDGYATEHIITIGWRGASDDLILKRLIDPELLFLTQDEDFLYSKDVVACIVLSRVRQARSLPDRIEVWRRAVRELIQDSPTERRFELMDDGTLIPWEQGPQNSWIARPPRGR